MTHEQITLALMKIRKGAKWSLRGDSLDGLTWLDNEQTRPTDEEILEKIE
jgi:hypothetical protein